MSSGSVHLHWREYRDGWRDARAEVIEEALIAVYVNGKEVASIMCTPMGLTDLALGFLANEGFIDGLDEVDHTYVSREECCVDVWLTREIQAPSRKIITSGCGGGVTFSDPATGVAPLQDDSRIDPERLFDLFKHLQSPDSLYARARGVHSAGLSDGTRILAIAEDVGRHNTIDKLRGVCLQSDLPTEGLFLLATGRVSSEMIHKGALMGCPIVASRNSPTSLSVAMAEAWNITLVGYVRQNTLRVYTHPERLVREGSGDAAPP
jgi:FdhD protein